MQEKTENILSITERIIHFIDYLNISRYKFSKKTGVSESVLLNLYKGKNKPSVEILEKILNVYPALNINWLLTGCGDMFTSEVQREKKPKPKDEEIMSCELCTQKDETIEVLKILTRTQQKQVDLLTSRVEDLESQLGQKKKAS